MQFVDQCSLFRKLIARFTFHIQYIILNDACLLCFDNRAYLNCSVRFQGRVRLIEQTNKECKEKQTNKACKESLEDWRSKSVDLEFSFKYLTEDKLS